MTSFENFNSKNTCKLFNLKDKFDLFKDLISKDIFPKVTLLTGEKGVGKSTLINHVLNFYFDQNNYNLDDNTINKESAVFKQILNNIFPNLIYLSGSDYKNVKIEDIRNLKDLLLKTPINTKKRFIIFDDVEKFNLNSMNGLLKIIEEPSKMNNFILINNKSKPLPQTIESRCSEIKIFLSDEVKRDIISSLLGYFNQKTDFKIELINISPGNFLRFNYIIDKNKINFEENILINFKKFLNLYKKEKNPIYQDLLIFLSDYYIEIRKKEDPTNYLEIIENRSFLIKSINDFFLYNLNQSTLMNSIERRLGDD